MPLSHRELNTLFRTLDHDPVLISVKFEGWLAWPLIKERLWRMYLGHGREKTRESPFRILARLCLGIMELAINLATPPRREFAALYSPRRSPGPDGRPMHPHLGTLLDGAQGDRYFRFIFNWEHDTFSLPRRGVLNQRLGGYVLALAAVVLRRNRKIREVSDRLASRLVQVLPEAPRAEIQQVCADQLARFAVRRRVCRRIFLRAGVRSIIVLDPDAKTSEIAAAKAEGICVLEMQHGMFSADEPDYSWTAAHRAARREMAVVDRVLVFGPYWQRELAKNGFWRSREVTCIGCPGVVHFRRMRKDGHRPSAAQVTVLFLTQAYVRDAALAFWTRALALQAEIEAESVFQLQLRVHPAEAYDTAPYEELARRFPAHCEFADPSVSVYQAIVEADIVAGFTSLAMAEAVGLGVPTVSICGGAAYDGFCGTFGGGGIESVVPHLNRPEDFLALIHRCRDPKYYLKWAKDTASCGATIFSFPRDTPERRLLHALETARPAD